jgi:hypothetical protein
MIFLFAFHWVALDDDVRCPTKGFAVIPLGVLVCRVDPAHGFLVSKANRQFSKDEYI